MIDFSCIHVNIHLSVCNGGCCSTGICLCEHDHCQLGLSKEGSTSCLFTSVFMIPIEHLHVLSHSLKYTHIQYGALHCSRLVDVFFQWDARLWTCLVEIAVCSYWYRSTSSWHKPCPWKRGLRIGFEGSLPKHVASCQTSFVLGRVQTCM